MSKTHCKGCAFLFVLQAKKSSSYTIRCLADADFVDSPLRKCVDVKGMELALEKNKSFDCQDKKIFSFKAVLMKKWLMDNLGDMDVRKVRLEEVKTEYERSLTESTGGSGRKDEGKKATEKISAGKGKSTKKATKGSKDS
jgi:hypothetical protein